MIKWAESREGHYIYELFLAEHDAEPQDWLVRCSVFGQLRGERRGALTRPPRFGPDAGDVAAAETAVQQIIRDMGDVALPTEPGSYEPEAMLLPPADPLVAAVLSGLLEKYVEAEQGLGLTVPQTSAYLELPAHSSAKGLYPFAITPRRDARMRRVIALMSILQNFPEAALRRTELLAATLLEDVATLKQLLAEVGLPRGASNEDA